MGADQSAMQQRKKELNAAELCVPVAAAEEVEGAPVAENVEYVTEFVKLNASHSAPTRIHHRELASAQKEAADLTELLLIGDYAPHDLPSVAAAFALVSNAYGVLIKSAEVEERLMQPSSIDDVSEFLGMKIYPVFSKPEYVRYYINTNIPVIMCLYVPTIWLLDDSGDARMLDEQTTNDTERTLICCVAFKHSKKHNHFGIAFDKENEVHIRYVDDRIIEKYARDVCLVNTDVRPAKGPKRKYIRIKDRIDDAPV